MTINTDANREQARDTDGKFGKQTGLSPEISLDTQLDDSAAAAATLSPSALVAAANETAALNADSVRSEDEFFAKYNMVEAPNGDAQDFESYGAALAAAGGDENRVWTITEDGYPEPAEGEQFAYVFDVDGENVTILASSQVEAESQLAGDDEDEDADEAYLEGVYKLAPGAGTKEDGSTNFTDSEQLTNMQINAGSRRVNSIGYRVTDEQWADESERYDW